MGLLVLHLGGLVLNAYVTHVSKAGWQCLGLGQVAWSWKREMGLL